MAKQYCYEYPRHSVTVDMAVFAFDGEALRVLLIERKHKPFAGCWALPGGFLEMDEPAAKGALRELREETGVTRIRGVEAIGFYSEPGRDPRGPTISLAHAAVVRWPPPRAAGGDDAAAAEWHDANCPPRLAFDHAQVLADARRWLATKLGEPATASVLLPKSFRDADIRQMLTCCNVDQKHARTWRARFERERLIIPDPRRARCFRFAEAR